MLWLAIGQRIGQYGITERRYFLTGLSVWLAGIALYYAITRSRDMRIIPATLCLGSLLAFAGPWGAYQVSERSQLGRLQSLLERNGMLVDGAAQPADAPVALEDRREISAALRYLVSTHGTERLVALFGDRLDAIDPAGSTDGAVSRGSAEPTAERIVGLLGLEYVGPWAPAASGGMFSYFMDWDRTPIPITGYDVWLQAENVTEQAAVITEGVALRYDSVTVALVLDVDGAEVATIPLADAVARAASAQEQSGRRGLDPESMRMEWTSERERLLIFIARMRGERSDEATELFDLDLRVFYARAP